MTPFYHVFCHMHERSGLISRTPRAEIFDPREIATVHVINPVVRRCFLMGADAVSGKDYGHRKDWFEVEFDVLNWNPANPF